MTVTKQKKYKLIVNLTYISSFMEMTIYIQHVYNIYFKNNIKTTEICVL